MHIKWKEFYRNTSYFLIIFPWEWSNHLPIIRALNKWDMIRNNHKAIFKLLSLVLFNLLEGLISGRSICILYLPAVTLQLPGSISFTSLKTHTTFKCSVPSKMSFISALFKHCPTRAHISFRCWICVDSSIPFLGYWLTEKTRLSV